jgi:phospholipase/carboxylesterase
MTGFVRTHVEAAEPSAVLGLGYSNGANMLASMLFAAPDLFDAAVLMHPLIPFEPRIAGSLAGKRILVTAGNHDPICPPKLTARLEAWLRADGAEVSVLRHEGGHEIRPEEIEAARSFLGHSKPAKEIAQ